MHPRKIITHRATALVLVVFACVPSPLGGAEPEAKSVTFEFDIQPLLTRFGCNSGACHGKSRGQNGFALSLLGFDSDFDYDSLVHAARGRRIFPAAPDFSLLLRKATAQIPHGGGERFAADSRPYHLLRSWIEQGAPRTPDDAPKLLRIVVEPNSRKLAPQETVSLRVWAEYSDNSRRDVTDDCAFASNDRDRKSTRLNSSHVSIS